MFMTNQKTVMSQYLFLFVHCYTRELSDCNVQIFLADFARVCNFQSLGTFHVFCQSAISPSYRLKLWCKSIWYYQGHMDKTSLDLDGTLIFIVCKLTFIKIKSWHFEKLLDFLSNLQQCISLIFRSDVAKYIGRVLLHFNCWLVRVS